MRRIGVATAGADATSGRGLATHEKWRRREAPGGLPVVSPTSLREAGAHDVVLKESEIVAPGGAGW